MTNKEADKLAVNLDAYVARFVAAERERCAQIADEYRAKCHARGPSWDDQATAAESIAARIRSGE